MLESESNAAQRRIGDSRLRPAGAALAICLITCGVQGCSEQAETAPGAEPTPVAARQRTPASEGALSVPARAGGDVAYPLDSVARTFGGGERPCPEVELSDFIGAEVEFAPSPRVAAPFRTRLERFEAVVAAVAMQFYGRTPKKIVVAASYGCRSVSGRAERMSEHALGNAIDVAGFDFAASSAWPDSPAALPFAFEVRVARHWKGTGDAALERHGKFLGELTRRLGEEQVFRTMLGPAHPDHGDHFHFDMAPSTYVDL